MARRLFRIRAVMLPEDMRAAITPRPRLRGRGLHVEVIGPDGEVLGLLACSAINIECTGRNEPITATVKVDVSEIDLVAEERD